MLDGWNRLNLCLFRSMTCTWLVQVVLFTNDKTISKGMVKYASNLSRESIIDVGGTIVVPQEPVVACTQSQVQLYSII